MSAESNGSTNTTEADAVNEELSWFQFPGWRWAFFNVIIWLMPILLAFGALLNILCFITIYRSPKTFPKISRRSMLIIAACDLLLLSLSGTNCYHSYWNSSVRPASVVPTFLSHMNDSAAACYLINYLYKYLLSGTPFFQVGLTIERVLAVTMPLKVKRIMTGRNHCILIAALFLLGSISPVLWVVEQELYQGRCIGSRDASLVAIIDPIQYNMEFFLGKVTLFIVLLSGCIIVAVALKLQSGAMARISSGPTDGSSKQRSKMVAACAVMMSMNIVFILVHGPKAAFSVYEGYTDATKHLTEGQLDLVYMSAEGVMFLHNIIDPFAYFIGKGFRAAFRRNLSDMANLVTCCARRRGHRAAATSTGVTSASL